jgi:hypothetical protein
MKRHLYSAQHSAHHSAHLQCTPKHPPIVHGCPHIRRGVHSDTPIALLMRSQRSAHPVHCGMHSDPYSAHLPEYVWGAHWGRGTFDLQMQGGVHYGVHSELAAARHAYAQRFANQPRTNLGHFAPVLQALLQRACSTIAGRRARCNYRHTL